MPSPETLFSIANTAVLPAWLLLIVAPRWKYTLLVARALMVPLLCGLYLYLLVTHFGESGGGFGTLQEVAKLFQSPAVLLAGWVHYLAFDLFTGSWEVMDAVERKIPHWMVIPCLLLTFMLGPIGLLLYLGVRRIKG